jgi:hypothetical protein
MYFRQQPVMQLYPSPQSPLGGQGSTFSGHCVPASGVHIGSGGRPIASLPSVAYTPAPGWDGDPVDYDAAVACLT